MSKWLRKSVVLYLLVFLLGTRIFDLDKIHLRILNSLVVPVDYLYDLSKGNADFDKETFGSYLNYYKQFIKYSPYSADALGMLAFCYSYLGEQSKAVSLYKKAIFLEPAFFWFHYNLGVIYFQQQKYPQAAVSLKRAFSVDRTKTLGLISNSHIMIYLGPSESFNFPVKKAAAQRDVYLDMAHHLREGLGRCQEMLVLSYFRMKDYASMLKWAQAGIKHRQGDIPFFYFHSGVAAYQLEDYPKAAVFLNKCIEKDPGYADAYYYLSLTLKAMKKEDQAAAVLKICESLRAMYPQGRPMERKEYSIMVF